LKIIYLNYNEPAPEKVTYDYTYFQDTLILDTLIVDTTYVEKIDGSNCTFAADGFCDTKPDYIASRWNCDENSNGFTEQTDPNGEKFYSDGSLFMSYALDNCSNRFTEDQIAAMRANLIDEKPSYLGNENVIDPIPDGEVAVVTPEELEVVSNKCRRQCIGNYQSTAISIVQWTIPKYHQSGKSSGRSIRHGYCRK